MQKSNVRPLNPICVPSTGEQTRWAAQKTQQTLQWGWFQIRAVMTTMMNKCFWQSFVRNPKLCFSIPYKSTLALSNSQTSNLPPPPCLSSLFDFKTPTRVKTPPTGRKWIFERGPPLTFFDDGGNFWVFFWVFALPGSSEYFFVYFLCWSPLSILLSISGETWQLFTAASNRRHYHEHC